MNLTRTAFLSFLIAVFTFVPMELIPADADSMATASNDVAATFVSTGTFIAYPTTSTNGANPNGSALTLSNTVKEQYFYVRNTGTVTISTITATVTYSASPARTSFARCDVGVLFASLNTCASGTTTIITTTSGPVTISVSIPPNSWVAFELDPKRLTTPTVSVSVSSTQIRPTTTTNS